MLKVTKRRTKQDFAHVMKDLVEIYFKVADRIRIVFDNLNTHTPTSFYESFRPEGSERTDQKTGISLHTKA